MNQNATPVSQDSLPASAPIERQLETWLAWFTLAGLTAYMPLETMASWHMFGGPRVLLHPGFLQSIVAFGLMLWGPVRSLRARPHRAPAVMCAAHAWCASLFWHAATLRMSVLAQGNQLFYGASELWVVVGGAGITVVTFALSLSLTVRADTSGRMSTVQRKPW